ncbi:unnamed protein product [Amoebophrya sp. A25]|nr:unnamed protein product [Amoebophrya sp. A25]|eukprot:GSA25T00023138001.1
MTVSASLALHRHAARIQNRNADKYWLSWWRYRGMKKVENFLEDDQRWHTCICILVSTVTFCMETVPQLSSHAHYWEAAEIFVVSLFSIEYLVRVCVTSRPLSEFLLAPLNLVDLLAIAPTWIQLILAQTVMHDQRFLRVVRLFWVFKFGRYSQDINLIVGGMMQSTTAFLMLFGFLALALVFFSFLMFATERGNWNEELSCYARANEPHYSGCSPFQNVPLGFYWAVTTITTVGYGDAFPITVFGRVVTGACMVVGLLCVACPTTVLGVEFSSLFDLQKLEAKRKVGRKEMLQLGREELFLVDQMKQLSTAKKKMEQKTRYMKQLIIESGGNSSEALAARLLCTGSDRNFDEYGEFLCKNVKSGSLENILRVALDL